MIELFLQTTRYPVSFSKWQNATSLFGGDGDKEDV